MIFNHVNFKFHTQKIQSTFNLARVIHGQPKSVKMREKID